MRVIEDSARPPLASPSGRGGAHSAVTERERDVRGEKSTEADYSILPLTFVNHQNLISLAPLYILQKFLHTAVQSTALSSSSRTSALMYASLLSSTISFGKSDLFFMDWLSLIEWLAP